jgi:predicted amidohydrolase YtcJ
MPGIGVDLIVHNANVITLDPLQPGARLVAIKGNRILTVDRQDEPERYRGSQTRLINCRGRTVIPGFNDAHCHVIGFASTLAHVDCSKMKSIAEIQVAIRERANQTPAGNWVTGAGYNEFYLMEKRHPTRWELDKVAPGHPVRLMHRTWHATVLNSLGLEQLGISGETPEPPGGVIERDLETGEPNGVLYEINAYLQDKLPPEPEEQIEKHITEANHLYLSQGITSLQDATVTNDLTRWQTLKRLKESGKLSSRLSVMMGMEALPQLVDQGISPGYGDDQLRLGGIKIIITQTTGALHPPQKELNRQVLEAQQAGFPVAIHAIEESSLEAAINALEYAQSQGLKGQQRHRIEHASECSPRLLSRLKTLCPIIVSQPPFIYYSGERYLREVPPEQRPWLYRFRSFWGSGIYLAASSDSPVVTNNPLVGIYAAVTRRAESGGLVGVEERLSVEQTLTAYTLNGAFASREEKSKGSISVGKLADLVVLSADPTAVPAEAIKDIRVEMTILDGQVVWQRAE